MKSCPDVIPVKKRDCIVQPTTYTETRLLGGRERERERERDGKFTNNIKNKKNKKKLKGFTSYSQKITSTLSVMISK